MNSKRPDGSTELEHLQAFQKMTGKPVEELASAPEMPDTAIPVWGWFVKLANKRGSTGFGPSPISYSEIQAFCKLNQLDLEPWEVDLICRFDDVAMQQYAEDYEKKRKQDEKKSKARAPKKSVGKR